MIAESVPLRSLIVESQNGLSKRSGDSGDEVAVLRLADISAGQIDESEPRRIRLSPSEREKYALRRGDLICIRVNGSRGLVGRIVPFTSPNAWAYCDHFIRLRPDFGRADHRYLTYYLNSSPVRRQLELSMVSSAGQHTVSQGTMLELPVPLPPIEQQREIVAEIEKQFSRLDEAVANLQRVKANLKRQRASILASAMAGNLVAAMESESWDIGEIGSVAKVISGLTKSPKREALPRKMPYLRVANVYANELRLGQIETIGVADNEVEKLLVRMGDLLVVEGNGSPDQIGRVALWDGSIPDCVHQNHLIKVRFGPKVMPQWALMWLLSPGGRREIEEVSSSTSGLHTLSTGKVSRLPIPIPPLEVQRILVAEVDRRLSIARGVEAQVEANLKRAQALRQAVLTKAFAV